MIHGMSNNSQNVTSLLSESKIYEFFPTGSQVTGGFCASSDRDYFIKYSWSVIDFLKCNNFKKLDMKSDRTGNEMYRDPSLDSVWEKLCVVEQRIVQIQVVKPDWMDSKYRANLFFIENPKILRRLLKRERADMWRAIMAYDKAMNVDLRPRGTLLD